MSGKQLIIDYFSSSLLTNLLSFEDFKGELVNGDTASPKDKDTTNEHVQYSEEELVRYYSYFKQLDMKRMSLLGASVEEMYSKINQFDLDDLRELLVENAHFTLQGLVTGLIQVDRLLQTRLAALNRSIQATTERLREFNDLIHYTDPEMGVSVLDSINKTLLQLQRYKQILQVAIDDEEGEEKKERRGFQS